MIKAFAQMRNLRRGHDTQGRLKKINIDETSEGYANFMAPLRIVEIHDNVQKELCGTKEEMLKKKTKEEMPKKKSKAEQEAEEAEAERAHEDAEKLKDILSSQVLQPQADMFLTPEWDEMVPFPNSKFCVS